MRAVAKKAPSVAEKATNETPQRVLLLATLAACVAWLCVFKVYDSDFWWHLRAGQWILQHHAVPRVDPFSWTIAGQTWVSFEWLSQVLFYALFALGGPAALILFKTLVVTALGACIVAAAGSGAAGLAGAVAACALAFGGDRAGFVERPQIFTFLLTAVYLLVLRGSERRPALIWALPALQALWANLHGGASIVGPVVIACWAGGQVLERRFRDAAALAGVAAACLAASLLNPFGWRIYSQLFGTVGFEVREVITEWAPLRFTAANAPIWIPLVMLEAASLAAWLADRERRAGEGLVWAAFLVLPFRAIRFAANALPVFAQLFAGNFGSVARGWKSRPAIAASAAAVSAAVAWGFAAFAYAGVFVPGLGAARTGADVAAFMRKAGLTGKMFNSYDLGGRLIWQAPERPVFIDGRSLEYGPNLVKGAMTWFRPEVWKGLEAEYRFDYAVLENSPFYLCAVLDEDPRWRLLYGDDEALVYARVDGADAAQAKDGYRLIRPNATDFHYTDPLFEKGQGAALLAEATRAVEAAPQHVNPRLLRVFVLRHLGKPEEALADAAEARRLAPEHPGPVMAEAGILLAAGRLDSAASDYGQVLALTRFTGSPQRMEAYNNLGVIAYRRGDREGAAAYWKKALALDPGNPGVVRNLRLVGGLP